MAGMKRNAKSTIGKKSTHGPMLGVTRKTPKKSPLPTGCPCDGASTSNGAMVVYPTFGPGG